MNSKLSTLLKQLSTQQLACVLSISYKINDLLKSLKTGINPLRDNCKHHTYFSIFLSYFSLDITCCKEYLVRIPCPSVASNTFLTASSPIGPPFIRPWRNVVSTFRKQRCLEINLLQANDQMIQIYICCP